jgi:aryl-alcohol dehydrogenase-like predicted oxidoreductase
MYPINVGSSGLVSSAIGLGTNAFTGVYGPVGKRECAEVIDLAIDIGVTMIDTADFYQAGDVESLLGQSLRERRDQVLLATHGGVRFLPGSGVRTVFDGRPSYLHRACDASLMRLRTDRIDLYYLSGIDEKVPVEESIGELGELVLTGKVRYIGIHNPTVTELRRAQSAHPISALAVRYSLCDRSAEDVVLAAAELGVGVVAYGPLASGLFADRTSAATSVRELAALREVERQAAELDLGVARLGLAWLANCRGMVPVPSTRSPSHLEMNASAADINLDAATCARLTRLFL